MERDVRRTATLILSLAVAAATLTASGSRTTAAPDELLRAFLRQRAGFSTDDLAAVAAGHGIVKLTGTKSDEEIAMFGAVRINAPVATFVERFKDITQFEHGAGVLQIGKIHAPPQLDDFQGLTFDSADLDAVRNCRPHDCDLQMSSSEMDRFRANVHWAAPDAAAQANRAARQMMFDIQTRYISGGTLALGAFDDHDKPISVRGEFDAVLSAALLYTADIPGLLPYLREEAPIGSLKGAEEFFYWARFAFGMKPTIRVNHVTLYPLADRADGIRLIVATKQVYASHYFSATLELRYLIDDPAHSGQAFYMLCSTQSRSQGFGGWWGGLIKAAVRHGARKAMENYMDATKQTVERQ
jgi:hypothetical protein